MSREELQALQTPLKSRYRDDPEAAVVTMTAEGDVDATAVSCSVQTGRALVEAGLQRAPGPSAPSTRPPSSRALRPRRSSLHDRRLGGFFSTASAAPAIPHGSYPCLLGVVISPEAR